MSKNRFCDLSATQDRILIFHSGKFPYYDCCTLYHCKRWILAAWFSKAKWVTLNYCLVFCRGSLNYCVYFATFVIQLAFLWNPQSVECCYHDFFVRVKETWKTETDVRIKKIMLNKRRVNFEACWRFFSGGETALLWPTLEYAPTCRQFRVAKSIYIYKKTWKFCSKIFYVHEDTKIELNVRIF